MDTEGSSSPGPDTRDPDDDDDAGDDEGSSEDDTTGAGDEGSVDDSGSESSGGPAGLDPLVSWRALVDDAATRAASVNPAAELATVGGVGMRADGFVDLSDVETDGFVEIRFWQQDADTGVNVVYGVGSYDPEAETYEPSVYPVNGSGFSSPPLWGVELLPSFAEVATAFAGTAGCGAFTGASDDRISIRVDWFTEAYVEVSASTATTETAADAATLAFASCE